MRPLLSVCALAALTNAVVAQVQCGVPGVTVTVTPTNAQAGEPIQVALTNGTGSAIQLPNVCLFGVRAGACDGTSIWPGFCPPIPTLILPGTTLSGPWDQSDSFGQSVAPGTYAIEVRYFDPNLTLTTCCFLVKILTSYQTYGAGCPGTLGVPALNGSGDASAGSQITLSGGNAQPNAPVLLAVGYGTTPFPLAPGCEAEIAPLAGVLLPLAMDAAGTFDLPVTIPPLLPPTLLTVQYVALDVTLPPSFLTVSNALAFQTS